MKILIHGRKNGYTVLYPKPTPQEFYSFASDIQSISANNYDIYYGKTFYTLAFVDGGCIFTKYVIGDDVERGQLGEIGISVFIPNTHELKGADVKTLLDELIDTYTRKKYIDDNKIVEPKNGFDWLLFTSLADGYDAKLGPGSSIDNIVKPGTKDPAFHYYKSDSELIEHLDKPFQEEYSDYKQILFIDSNLQGKANPLHVLKNSGVEINPDLKNENYYLNSDNRSREIYITANGKPRSDKEGENQIRAKWQVEIKYSKDPRCYKPIYAKGTISDKSSEIHDYIEVKDKKQVVLKYEVFNNPIKEEKPVTFIIKDQNGKRVEGADIQIGTRHWETIKESSTTINFRGEDIVKEWSVSAKKESENLYSSSVPVMPENENNPIVLTLQKHKLVKFQGVLNDGNDSEFFTDIKISIPGKSVYSQKPECYFIDDEIYQTYKVTATYSNNRGYYKGEKEFRPENVKLVSIELNKSIQEKHYKVEMGGHGSASAGYSNSETGNDISVTVKTKEYVFKGFKLDKNKKQGNYEGTLVAQYEKQKSFVAKVKTFFSNPSVIATSLISLLVLALGIWVLYSLIGKDIQPKEISLNKWKIEMYVEGDSLMLDKLNGYKENWKKQEQDFITKSGGGIFGGNENVDSSKWKNDWKPANESINRAIKKRELINNNNIAKLRNQDYSKGQLSFETAIKKIDSTSYAEVGTMLGDVSAMTLAEIAEKINEILKKPKELAKEETTQEQKREENKTEQKKETSKKNDEPKKKSNLQEQETAATDKTSEIIQYIKGSELDKEELKEYKNTKGINQNLKNSIQLCLDFWELDGSGSGKKSKTYWTFRDKINADDNFNNSKLKAFINETCREGANLSYSEQDKRKGLK